MRLGAGTCTATRPERSLISSTARGSESRSRASASVTGAIVLTLGDDEQARLRASAGMGVDRAPIGDDEALGPELLQPDIMVPDAMAPSMRLVSNRSNAVNSTSCRSMAARQPMRKVVIGGSSP